MNELIYDKEMDFLREHTPQNHILLISFIKDFTVLASYIHLISFLYYLIALDFSKESICLLLTNILFLLLIKEKIFISFSKCFEAS